MGILSYFKIAGGAMARAFLAEIGPTCAVGTSLLNRNASAIAAGSFMLLY
jgi:hypothetical protein